jgi:lysophospholipase L1-like esterase
VSQLSAAEDFISKHNVGFVTLTIGGNDFLGVLHVAMTQGVSKAMQMLPAVQTKLTANLQAEVGALRQADPSAAFILTDQYDPLDGLPAGAFKSDGAAILSLAQKAMKSYTQGIKQLAAATHSIYADTYDAFLGKAPQLTWITSGMNIHPNAKRYSLFSQVVWAAYADAALPLTVKVNELTKVKPGALQTLKITTLPKASVTTTLSYSQYGWPTTDSLTKTADFDGLHSLTGKSPIAVHQVKVNTCAPAQLCRARHRSARRIRLQWPDQASRVVDAKATATHAAPATCRLLEAALP